MPSSGMRNYMLKRLNVYGASMNFSDIFYFTVLPVQIA